MNYEVEGWLYRVTKHGRIELVDELQRYVSTEVGERYFFVCAHSGRVLGEWEVQQAPNVLVKL